MKWSGFLYLKSILGVNLLGLFVLLSGCVSFGRERKSTSEASASDNAAAATAAISADWLAGCV